MSDQPVGAVPALPSEPEKMIASAIKRLNDTICAHLVGEDNWDDLLDDESAAQILRELLTAALAAATQERDKSVDAEGNRITEALVAFPELDLDPNNGDGVDSADPADWLRSMISASIGRAVERAEADAEPQVQALRALSSEMRGAARRSREFNDESHASYAARMTEWAGKLDQILSSPSASDPKR